MSNKTHSRNNAHLLYPHAVERLFFPQYGDTGLYDQCGRKHYQRNIEARQSKPYAVFISDADYINLLKRRPNDTADIEGSTPESLIQKQMRRKVEFERKRNKQNSDALDRQVQQSKRDASQRRAFESGRMKTIESEHLDPYYQAGKHVKTLDSEPIRGLRSQASINMGYEGKAKTQGINPNRKSKYNPTFMSSLMY